MALRAVIDHPKFHRLMNLMKVSRMVAIGALESMWQFTARFTPNGHIGKYPVEEIEAWLGWDGEEGALLAMLEKARWVDRHPVHGLIVHDWADHCDSFVHTDLAKKTQLFIDGRAPRIDHDAFNTQSRARIRAEYEKIYGPEVWESPRNEQEVRDQTNETAKQSGTSPGLCDENVTSARAIPEPVPEPEPEPVAERATSARTEISADPLPDCAPPIGCTVEAIEADLRSRGWHESRAKHTAAKFWETYNRSGWRDGQGRRIANWRLQVQRWHDREPDFAKPLAESPPGRQRSGRQTVLDMTREAIAMAEAES